MKHFIKKISLFALPGAFVLIAVFAFLPFKTYAIGESCFIQLEIKETKIKDILDKQGKITGQEVQFSLESLENIYEYFPGSIEEYNPDSASAYILNVYDGSGKVKKYPLSSARFVLWDCFSEDCDEPGGLAEQDQGVISVVIPYQKNIAKITVSNKDKETDLKINPADIKCERTCRIENEFGIYGVDKCCLGFIPSTQPDGSFVCVKCGDGICSEHETKKSCPMDCPGGKTPSVPTDQPGLKTMAGKIVSVILAVLTLLAFVFVFIIIFKSLKKK